MRVTLISSIVITLVASSASAFAPVSQRWGWNLHGALRSSTSSAAIDETQVVASAPLDDDNNNDNNNDESSSSSPLSRVITPLTAAQINARLTAQLEKLKEKDRTSMRLQKNDLKVVYEDEHIVVVDKPSGVLCVPGKEDNPSLAQAVFESYGSNVGRMDQMVVHRLGFDTSGLVVFARTMEALRGMNNIFRTRKIERHYEALVCGHVQPEEGMIDLPIMRDYEFPPYMRVSTLDHQRALVDLDPEEVGKKLLERPKDSLTKYKVIAREELEGNAVTRIQLISISGRTHQLNVHCAALGHPIVGDAIYGINGDAALNGGLSEAEQQALAPNPSRASAELQQRISQTAKSMCVHAKSLKFRHPVTKKDVSLSSDAPF